MKIVFLRNSYGGKRTHLEEEGSRSHAFEGFGAPRDDQCGGESVMAEVASLSHSVGIDNDDIRLDNEANVTAAVSCSWICTLSCCAAFSNSWIVRGQVFAYSTLLARPSYESNRDSECTALTYYFGDSRASNIPGLDVGL